jgi:ubiquitin-conjugating enzyme E2 J2
MPSKKPSTVRLQKELKQYVADPPPFIPRVYVNEKNVLEWHLLMQGPHDTPFEGGWYVARIKFPEQYPFKPPDLYMCTPNGRFETGKKLCMSMSSFHPETWNPSWNVSKVALGMLSFLLEDELTTGAIRTSEEQKREYAEASVAWNLAHGGFGKMFPELDGGLETIAEKKHEKRQTTTAARRDAASSTEETMSDSAAEALSGLSVSQ